MNQQPEVRSPRRLTRTESQAQTRHRLLDAGEKVFAERGFYGAAIETIAERAGLSSGAFYSNFESKAELLLALLERESAGSAIDVAQILEQNPLPADFFRALKQRRAQHHGSANWFMLQMEFVLYCMRNPEARRKLGERERAERDMFTRTIVGQYENIGVSLPAAPEEIGMLLRALEQGFHIQENIDPAMVSRDAFIDALELLSRAFAALAREGL